MGVRKSTHVLKYVKLIYGHTLQPCPKGNGFGHSW